MKYILIRKLTIQTTLDSYETIMFHQGGQHKISLPNDSFNDKYDEIELTIQIEKSQQERHDWMTKCAAEAIIRRDEDENTEA